MHNPIRSAAGPSGPGRAKVLASSLALTIAAFGSVAAVSAGTASAANTYPPVVTQDYAVGTAASSVSNVTAAVSPTTPNTAATYSVKFTTPSALTVGAGASSITIAGTGIPSISLASVADLNSGFAATEPVTALVGGNVTITLSNSAGSINAGDTVLVSMQATTPSVPMSTSYTFAVSTSANTTPVDAAAAVTITPSITAPTASQSSQVLGAGSTYGLSGIQVLTSTAVTSTTLTLANCSAPAVTGNGQSSTNPCTTAGGITWSAAAGSYSVTELTGTAATAAITVTGVSVAGDTATLSISGGPTGGILQAGDTLSVTATGTNPTASQSDALVIGVPVPAQYYEESGNTVSFGGQVSGVTVAPSPATAGSTATYVVNFSTSSTGALSAGQSIKIVAPKGVGFTSSVGAVVTDTTTGVSEVVAGVNNGLTTTTNADDTLVLPVNMNIGAGNAVSVTLFNVTNPATGSYAGANGFQVSTTTDLIASTNATAVVITPPVVTTESPIVTLSNSATGGLSNYTIASFKAVSALVGGTDTIEVQAPSGTLLPSAATLTDATTNSGTQTMSVVTGAGTNDATYKLTTNVAANDVLSLTLSGVVNPGTASTTNQVTLGADNATTNATVAGTQGLGAIAPTFPTAGVAAGYPDAAIVAFGSTIYVFAGGHAFGIPTPAALGGIQAVDNAKIQTAPSGATVPAAAPAIGAVIVAYNNPTIYVVGTDGQLHGFATPAQFLSDGYDPADVITVPGTGGLTVGATAGTVGAGANAAATGANGAIVNSSGTFYVFAGGKAFGIPTPAALTAVRAADMAAPLSGTVTAAQTGATVRNGTLITYNSAVYVVSGGNAFEFKSMAQLQADGYSGTPSIVVPNLGGMGLVTTYSGS